MNGVGDLVQRAISVGLTLQPRGGVLRVRGPRRPAAGLLSELRDRKHEVLAYLRRAPREAYAVEREHAARLGPDGCRREFLGATWFVDEAWSESDALVALSAWYRRDLATLEPAEWIVGAAHADEVWKFRPGGEEPRE